MSAVAPILRSTGRSIENLPDLRAVHWLPRVLLAAIILQQGWLKIPITAETAQSLGIPLVLYGMSALGEIAAGVALLVGGAMRNPIGELLTRAGGLTIAFITFSVLVVVYQIFTLTPDIIWLSNQLHLLLIAGGLYIAARGNAA